MLIDEFSVWRMQCETYITSDDTRKRFFLPFLLASAAFHRLSPTLSLSVPQAQGLHLLCCIYKSIHAPLTLEARVDCLYTFQIIRIGALYFTLRSSLTRLFIGEGILSCILFPTNSVYSSPMLKKTGIRQDIEVEKAHVEAIQCSDVLNVHSNFISC